jgi:hypothetical protein
VGGQAEVNVRAADQIASLFDEIICLADGVGMGVFDDGRHPACGGSRTAGREVLALGRPGIHEVDVGVDHPRENQQPGRVDGPSDHCQIRLYRLDHAVADSQVGSQPTRAGHYDSTFDSHIGHWFPPDALQIHNL